MIKINDDKIKKLKSALQEQTAERYDKELNNIRWRPLAKLIDGKKYIKVNLEYSGKFMVDKITEEIYGIKAYGQINRGHFFGTLDTISNYFWGDYRPVKIKG